jgi:hypothetical protein
MKLSLQCSNRGCGKINVPYLDPTDDKAYCSLCDKEMILTPFVKTQMKSNKQFRQRLQPKPYAVKCQRCGKDDQPILVNNNVVCVSCRKPLDHLSEPFKIMLREKLKNTKDE